MQAIQKRTWGSRQWESKDGLLECFSLGELSPLSTIPEDHLLVAFKSFLDGGNQADSREYNTVTLAAMSANYLLWDVFTYEWQEVLHKHGAQYLHTTDAVTRNDIYKGWPKTKANQFIDDCASVICRHATTRNKYEFTYLGIRPANVTVFLSDFKRAFTCIPDLGTAEELCAIYAVARCQSWALWNSSNLELFFDQGEPFYGHFLDRLRNKKAKRAAPDLGKNIMHHGASDMRSVPALQATDLLAWCINHKHKCGVDFEWQKRVLAIDRDEEIFRYKRLIKPNMDRLTTVRSWGMPKRRSPK
jgi:hypothetical protein